MLTLLLIAGLVMLAAGVVILARGIAMPSGRTPDAIDQIGAYGFTGIAPAGGRHDAEPREGSLIGGLLDRLADWFGGTMSRRTSLFREQEMRERLVGAGMYTTSARKVFGYQFVLAIGLGLVWLWLGALQGQNAVVIVVGTVLFAAVGWILPVAYVERKRRVRLRSIERGLPDLIDLLVVTIEGGLSFMSSMRLAAEKVSGPLAQELRLTLQEQNMGLTLAESLKNLQVRADTQGIRSFVRAITQGETLGVSIGMIMRNLAVEMRKKRKAYAEEMAQKAPVKMLFPLVFLIFPAIFIVLLLPALLSIGDQL